MRTYIDLEIKKQFLLRDLVPLRNRMIAMVSDGKLEALLKTSKQNSVELQVAVQRFVEVFIEIRKKINEIFRTLESKAVFEDHEDLTEQAEALESGCLEALETLETHEGFTELKQQLQSQLDSIQSALETNFVLGFEKLKAEALGKRVSSKNIFGLLKDLYRIS